MKRIFASVLALIVVMLSIFSNLIVVNAEEKIFYKNSTTHTFQTKRHVPNGIPAKCYNFYFVVDSYSDYIILDQLGLSNGLKKSFFDDKILLINYMINRTGTVDDYINEGVTKENQNIFINYSVTREGVISTNAVNYDIDYITLKKSDVRNVNLKKINISVKFKYLPIESGLFKRDYSEEDEVLHSKYIDIGKYAKSPSQVTKVKLKFLKKKQLKITWKKIKGTKYQVQYSLKKNMKKAKTKKNIKKNSVTLKKLKSNKKYYVRVRAYKTVNGKKYFGKWSKKSAKTVK